MSPLRSRRCGQLVSASCCITQFRASAHMSALRRLLRQQRGHGAFVLGQPGTCVASQRSLLPVQWLQDVIVTMCMSCPLIT